MTRRTLLLTLFILALSGLLLHYRIHSFLTPDRLNPGSFIFDGTKFLSFIFPLFDIVLVTLLFASRKTAVYGYLLNGLIGIYGTVFMAHFSIAEISARHIPPESWLQKSTLPDIGIAWADFFAGKALYDLVMKG